MKSDLDRLMAERNIDALFTLPGEHYDTYRAYLANGADFSGMVFKKRGHAPVLLANLMEVDEAARSGLTVYSYEDFEYGKILKEHQDDRNAASLELYRRVFDKLAITGNVGLYGVGDLGTAINTVRALEAGLAEYGITLVFESARQSIFDRANETKDPDEIARLRAIATRTSAVVCATRDWLSTHRAEGDTVVDAAGAPLTIGAVKRFVRGQLFEHDLEDAEGMIFAQGRDAGVPHSAGEDDQVLKTGESIVFDLFPCEPKGYFHDMTRTWCLGYARADVQEAWDAVWEAFERAIETCKPGVVTNIPQRTVCEYFESLGHPTVLNSPGTTEGYVHSLAHGLGLNIHEAPYFPTQGTRYTIQAGSVFTIEPGLYYPERGFGVRIEDTVFMNEGGTLETLTDVPYDLVIKLNG